jgi:hypothetical protein
MSLGRRSLAVGLCLCLLTTPSGWAQLPRAGGIGSSAGAGRTDFLTAGAADSPPADPVQGHASPKEVLDYLERHHAFDGDNAKLRGYVGTATFTTPLGGVLYRYLRSQADPDEEVRNMQSSLKALVQSGDYTEKKGAAAQVALRRYRVQFGGLPPAADGSAEDTFELGTLREAMMTGASVIDAPKAGYTQVDLGREQGWEFRDQDGVAFVLNKNKVAIYNRELQKMQRELNQTRPLQASFVPETGRYNYEMFGVSYWRLKLQAGQLEVATRLDRMVCMAELLGEQKKDQVFFDRDAPDQVNAAFEAELTRKAKTRTYSREGRAYSVWDIAEAKTRVRDGYLKKAAEGISWFRGEMEKFKGATSITDSRVKSMEMGEQFVTRYLSLAFLEAQKYALRGRIERLEPASPDSELVVAGLKTMPLDPAAKSRYQGEGDKLRARLERLLAVLGRVEDALCKTDYASNLDLAQAALNSSQKEIGEIGSDYELYTAAPGMVLALRQQSGGWRPSCNGSADPRRWSWGFWHKAAAGAYAGSSYAKGIEEANRSLPAYQAVAGMIADGRYGDARAAIIKLNPEAVHQHPAISLNGETGRINEAARLAAALQATRDNIARIAAVNRWVDTAGSLIAWSSAVGLGAPIVSKGLAVVETCADKAGLKLVAALAEQTRLRLASLEPAPETVSGGAGVLGEYLRHSAYRAVSSSGRQAVFSLMSGTLSGAAAALGDAEDRAPFKLKAGLVEFGEGGSNFKGPGDAFAQGFSGGLRWANESFHPMLGYIGLPSSYFEGGPLAAVAQTLGEKGAFGAVAQGVQWAVEQLAGRSEPAAKGIAAKAGGSAILAGAGKVMRFAWGLADNLAKYRVFSAGVGWAAKQAGWYLRSDEADVVRPGVSEDEKERLQDMPPAAVAGLERRIKRSEKDGAALSESPLWLLIPVSPAKYEAAARSYQRSAQGEDEYLQAGQDAVLANAEADRAILPLLGRSTLPLMQRIFNYNAKPAADAAADFLVTKDIKRRAIARELQKHVSGGGAEADLGAGKVREFLAISRSDPAERKMIGGLFNNDDVRNEARKQCVLALVHAPSLAEKILSAEPGSEVEGFGRVDPGVQREVAAMMLEELPAGIRVSAKIQGLARGRIRRYLDSNSLGKPGGPAERLLKASAANVHESPAQAEAFNGFIKELRESVSRWGQDLELRAVQKPYRDVARELSRQVEAKFKAGALTPEQFDALSSMFKLIAAQEGRFQSFNNVETTYQLVDEELSALRVQYQNNPEVQGLLARFGSELSDWRGETSETKRTTAAADDAPFQRVLGGFNKAVKEALSRRAISAEDAAVLRDAVNRGMKGAPYILHDSKGTALSGWRPGQFVAYFDALTKVVESRGAGVRAFERLTTGGGKTLLAFEGLMPIAEADARLEGKGRKVAFFTVQSNLDAQAQLEWRSLRKVGSRLEFDTYEGLKSKIAEAKNQGRTYVDKVWILGDELDGAALQPALALGERTGEVARENPTCPGAENPLYSIYRRMKDDAYAVARSPMWERDGAESAKAVKLYDRRVDALTRKYAKQMMKAVLADRLMPAGQRDRLFAKALLSYLRPKGAAGRGSSYVREEFMNLVRGYHADYAAVRMDNLTGKINVIHNGQWFESMDEPSRRFWELEYGADLTLPYTHQALSTIKDVTSDKKARMFALSATAGEKYIKHLGESGISIGGRGARTPANQSVDLRGTEGGKFLGVREAVSRAEDISRGRVAVRPAEILGPETDAPPEVRAFLKAGKDALVLRLDALPEGPVHDYFAMLRGRQPHGTALVVISLPDTRALKTMRRYLIKSGLAAKEEIAQVFSDTEHLRRNRPQADVAGQMNLSGMKSGRVKFLLLDTRVGGRGLDLDYRGDRGDPRPEAFKGYTNYEMLVMDPNRMSAVHLLQAEGRIDAGRVLPGAQRDFRLLLDIKSLQKDAVFEDMWRNNRLFVNLRNDPAVLQFAREQAQRLKHPVDVDWALIDFYIKRKGGPDNDLAARYNGVIADSLDRRQQLIEEDQLRQSAVLQDRPSGDPKLRWLDSLQRGR